MNRIRYLLTQEPKLGKEHIILRLPKKPFKPSCSGLNRLGLTPGSRNQSLDLRGISRLSNYSTGSYCHNEYNRKPFQSYFKNNMSTRSKLSSHHNQQFVPASGHNPRRSYVLSSTDNYIIKDSNLISQKLLEEGRSLLEMKSNVKAISLFDRAFHLDPGKLEALFYKAIALMDSNKYEEAIDTFLQVINKDSSAKVKTAYLLLAIAYKKNNQVELGIKILNDLLKKHKNNLKALMYKGKLLAEIGNWQEAKNTFDIAMKLNTSNIGTYLAIFDCEYHLKNYKTADELYNKILKFGESVPIKSIIKE